MAEISLKQMRNILREIGDDLVDTMWELWDTKDGYWNGYLPNRVCQRLFKCNKI